MLIKLLNKRNELAWIVNTKYITCMAPNSGHDDIFLVCGRHVMAPPGTVDRLFYEPGIVWMDDNAIRTFKYPDADTQKDTPNE